LFPLARRGFGETAAAFAGVGRNAEAAAAAGPTTRSSLIRTKVSSVM